MSLERAREEPGLDLDDPEEGGFTEINIVPLVDIMLVLLVILMATSTAILEQQAGQKSGYQVRLPSGSNPDYADTAESLVVAVLADGRVVSGGEELSETALQARFEAEAKRRPDQTILIQADEETPHHWVVRVMEAARKAGLVNLAIATRPDA